MADYGVNIAVKFNETKLNKLTKKLDEASKSAKKINSTFKALELKTGTSLNKVVQGLDKKLQKQKAINQGLKKENKLLAENVSLQRQALQAGKAGGGKPGGGFGGGGKLSQAVLGGGFPLLFGGGPLQAVGGAVGGAFGGFAGGIAGQLLVGQFEQLGRAAAELGQAFSETGFNLERVAEATGIAGTETEAFLKKIEQYGSSAQAAELATRLLATKVGEDGVQALTKFGDDAQKLGNNLGVIFTQVLSEIARVAGPLLNALAKFAGEQAALGAFKKRTGLTGKEKLAQDILLKGTFGGAKSGLGGSIAETLQKAKAKQLGLTDLSDEGLKKFAMQTALASQQKFELPVIQQIKSAAAGVQTPEQIAALNKAIKEAERFMQQRQQFEDQQAKLIERKLELRFKETKALDDQETILRARLAGNEQEVRDYLRLGELQNRLGEEEGKRQFDQEIRIRKLKEEISLLDQMDQVYAQIGMSIKSGVVDAISAAVDGTKSLAEVASNMLRTIANQLLNVGVNLAMFGVPFGTGTGGGLFGGFLASGGPAKAGKSYIVGEKGPELFTPNTSGTVTPNSALGAMGGSNIVVNVDAGGSNVQGDGNQAKALGAAIGLAVQNEIIKQKKPGGLLY